MTDAKLVSCPCKRTKCKRFNKCDECIAYHSKKKKPPYCKREIVDQK